MGWRGWLALIVAIAAAFAWRWRHEARPTTTTGRPLAIATDAAQSAAAQPAVPTVAIDAQGGHAIGRDAPAPASTAQEPGTPAATAAPVEASALPAPTPAQARAWMRERQREDDCFIARGDHSAANRERREWPWMPPGRVAIEKLALEQARGRLLQDCPAQIADADARRRHWAQRQQELEAARRAGDLHARLTPGGLRTPEERERARGILYDALLSGDPDTIAMIGRMQDHIQPPRVFDADPQAIASYVWPLVGCDLGMDCGPGSRALDLACLSHGAGCGYADLSELYRNWLAPWQYRQTERRRAEIVARIRRGDIAGMFDPPTPRAGEGP